MTDSVNREDMSYENIRQMLNLYEIKAELCHGPHEYLKIDGPSGHPHILVVDSEKMLLIFQMNFRLSFEESLSREEKLAFVNKLNSCVVVSRFFIPSDADEMLSSNYCIDYKDGVTSLQIIDGLYALDMYTTYALEICDATGLTTPPC
ncbi:YbjN domain-containing protein [Enterovibrio makurazakiensis]|uniref:hypothetical protein n=1 Tax=Enterovibrio makurazakiensis TaxID=2910232 RepID=UPI003D1E0F7F